MVSGSGGGEAMLRQRAAPYPNVLVDVDTQVDFLTAEGKRPVVDLAVVANIQRVFRWARRYHLTVISSLDIHRPTDPRRDVPVHCLHDTPGAEKMPFTLLPRRLLVQTDDTIHLPPDLLLRYRQVLFVKRGDDLTRNPKADRLLTDMPVASYILFGAGLEESIRVLALELLARRQNVWLVSDACGAWDTQAADLALRQIAAKNGRVLTTDELLQVRPTARARRTRPLRRLRNNSDSPADPSTTR